MNIDAFTIGFNTAPINQSFIAPDIGRSFDEMEGYAVPGNRLRQRCGKPRYPMMNGEFMVTLLPI